jgi:hypothetical protein
MRAGFRVDARVGNAQPLDRPPVHQVLFDNLGGILGLNASVPDGFWIDNDSWAMLALIQAQGLVDADIRQACSFCELLQLDEDFALSIRCAGRSGCSLGTNVMADKDVMLVKRQTGGPPQFRLKAGSTVRDGVSQIGAGGSEPKRT